MVVHEALRQNRKETVRRSPSRDAVRSLLYFPGKVTPCGARTLPLDFLHDEGFHDIAFVDIGELVKSDTAFIACRNLTRIVLESLERCDTVLGDNDTVADYADLRVS